MAAAFSSSLPEPVISSAPLVLLLLAMASFYVFKSSRSSSSSKRSLLPTNWPIVGVLPALAANLGGFHDYIAVILAASGHNFMGGGLGVRFFVTCDPENVRHIFTTNHGNYPKGEEFAEIFDVMSGSFFTVDGEACQRQRAKIKSVLSSTRLLARMAACCRDKVENGLLSSLASTAGSAFDMQELITRFVFDLTSMPVFGVDPGLLSSAGDGTPPPPASVADAMDTVMEVALFRHTVPPSCWKAMRWLKVGPERKLAAAHAVLAGFITEMMERRKKNILSLAGSDDKDDVVPVDILSSYAGDPDYQDDQLLRATLVNYMIAGRDTIGTTLPWLFYNLAMNPHAVSRIRDELSPIASSARSGSGGGPTMTMFSPEETKPLVYLQAALYESLRLHPPGPIERKTVAAADVMPSGHAVRVGDTVLVSLHAMGKMEGVWGEDCAEYKPERWLLSGGAGGGGGGRLRYVPTHKFLAFNSGPRMCLGKEIALMQMKTAVAAVVWNFDVEVVKGQIIEPKVSCILQMKNGLMVKAKKRETYQ